jgi:hypothetical protein
VEGFQLMTEKDSPRNHFLPSEWFTEALSPFVPIPAAISLINWAFGAVTAQSKNANKMVCIVFMVLGSTKVGDK